MPSTKYYPISCATILSPETKTQRQGIVGHASPAMTKIYSDHSSNEDRRRFMLQLPDYFLGDTADLGNPDRDKAIRLLETAPLETVRRCLALLTFPQDDRP